MSSDDAEEADDGPEDAFALVGDGIRASILQTLGEARGREGPRAVLSFSDLRERAAPEVPSSQFNYHLQQLVGHFVESTDDGYRLRHEGTTLYRTIRAGTFVRDDSVDPFEVGLDCYFCGSPVEASYEEGLFAIQCPGCDYPYHLSSRIPSGTVEDESTLLSRVDRYRRHKLVAFANGVCPTCANDLDGRFVPPAESPFPGADRREVYVHRSCSHCYNQDYMTVGEALLYDPEVIAFCNERGLDVTTTPVWELPFAATDRTVTVRETDPWEVAIRIEVDGDALELVVDEDLAILERDRE